MSSITPFNDARAIITAANLGVPIAWPNEPVDVPSGDPPGHWITVECVGDVLAPLDIGANVWQERGTLYLHINAPVGVGSDTARTLAKRVTTAFRGLQNTLVSYRAASIGVGQLVDPEGLWWTLTVSIDWTYQDVLFALDQSGIGEVPLG